jgi:hypothetical protein
MKRSNGLAREYEGDWALYLRIPMGGVGRHYFIVEFSTANLDHIGNPFDRL